VDEFVPFLFEKLGFKREQFKVVLTQYDYYMIARKGYASFVDPYVYLKHLNKVWDFGQWLCCQKYRDCRLFKRNTCL